MLPMTIHLHRALNSATPLITLLLLLFIILIFLWIMNNRGERWSSRWRTDCYRLEIHMSQLNRDMTKYVKEKYGHAPINITENGMLTYHCKSSFNIFFP
ncbi:hypothetical protein AKJ16_DCAP06887 [Drosera capensis]